MKNKNRNENENKLSPPLLSLTSTVFTSAIDYLISLSLSILSYYL